MTWVMNITDIDDKIIRGAAAAGIGIGELAERHLERFLADASALRMTMPDVLPRATEHIDQMVTLISTLLDRDQAYRTDDGSIFFRIASWPAYGRLSRLDPEGLRVGERVEADEYAKDDVRDFALWKGPKPGEPSWETAIGPGRPGWHIECSAMSMAHLGTSFDIHTGGVDLIFPHHEDEIAQSEAATGQPFVATWLHCAHLQMGGSKMAKSTGNIARVGELLEAGVGARALRLALISVHYRAALSHSDESLAAAAAAIERLDAVVAALTAYREDRADDPTLPEALDAAREAYRRGAGRRPERVGRAGGLVRPGPRAEPTDRATGAVQRRCRARARMPARSRPRPGGAARRRGRARSRDRSACSRPARPPARHGTGVNRIACETSWPTSGSSSRTLVTVSAGGGPRRWFVADRPRRDDDRRGRPAPRGGRPGGPGRPSGPGGPGYSAADQADPADHADGPRAARPS